MESLTFSFPPTVEALRAEAATVRELLFVELQNEYLPPPEGRWSHIETAYHIHLTEKSVTRGIQKFLDAPERHEPKSEEELRAMWHTMIKVLPNRSLSFPAPERLTPLNPPSLPEIIELLHSSRAYLLQTIDGHSYQELASISFPHPIFGALTGVSWITMIAHHELRHIDQMRELKSA